MKYENQKIHLQLNGKYYDVSTVRCVGELLVLEIGGEIMQDVKAEGENPDFDIHEYAFKRIGKVKRELRFVTKENQIIDITSKRHNTMTPKEVENFIKSKHKLTKINNSFLKGILMHVREKDGIKYYVQIYPGNIVTTRAIQVCTCYEIYGFFISSFKFSYIKVKRIDILCNMKELIEDAIKKKIKELEENDMPSNKIPISKEEAKELLGHLLTPKGIMDSAINEILENFQDRPKTTFDLAISCAYVATLGKNFTKPTSRQKVSTEAHRILLIEDKEELKIL